MNKAPLSLIAIVVDQDASPLTLAELCRACRVSTHDVANWVADGIVEPVGAAVGVNSSDWLFGGIALRRALTAARLARELEVKLDSMALVLDLLDEIDRLQAKLRRAGLA